MLFTKMFTLQYMYTNNGIYICNFVTDYIHIYDLFIQTAEKYISTIFKSS